MCFKLNPYYTDNHAYHVVRLKKARVSCCPPEKARVQKSTPLSSMGLLWDIYLLWGLLWDLYGISMGLL